VFQTEKTLVRCKSSNKPRNPPIPGFGQHVAALAQLERDIIVERTKAGLGFARIRGRMLGAPNGLSKKNKPKSGTSIYGSGDLQGYSFTYIHVCLQDFKPS
jgi:hypothetical protein